MERVRPAREREPEKEEEDVKRVQAARPDKAEVWEEVRDAGAAREKVRARDKIKARDKAEKNDFDNGLFAMEVLRCQKVKRDKK